MSKIPYQGPETENIIVHIKNGLRKNAKRCLIVDSITDTSWTGEEIEQAILCIADQMINVYGIKKGQTACIYGSETDQVAVLMLALISCGAVPLMLNQDYSGEEVKNTTQFTKARFLFATAERLQQIQESTDKLGTEVSIFSMDKKCSDIKVDHPVIKGLYPDHIEPIPTTELTFDELIKLIPIDPENDLINIQFSSGTTGKPKIIPRTHKNYAHLVASVYHKELMDLGPTDAIAGSIQLTHRPGMWCLLTCLKSGSKMVVGSNLGDVELNLSVIDKHKVTIFASSLPLLALIGTLGVELKKKYDTSHLKHIITSGAKIINFDLPKKIVEEYNLQSLRQCFGMTESGWVFLIEQSQSKDNFLTVGHVVPGTEVIIIDRETGQRVGPNVKGELALRGPQIFPGYLTDTAGVYNRSDFTDEGWFRTGDQAYYDDDELVFIEGRYKELMIFPNNFRYFPNDIEAVLSEHPAIVGACVVKVGEIRTHAIHDVARAYVILKSDLEVSEAEIIEFVKAQCTMIMLEGGIRFIDQFPRLHNGKVDKSTLKSLP